MDLPWVIHCVRRDEYGYVLLCLRPNNVFLSVSYLLCCTFCSLCHFFAVNPNPNPKIIYITHTYPLVHKRVDFISLLFPWLCCKTMGRLLWKDIEGYICSVRSQNSDIMSPSHFCINHTASYCHNNKQIVCNFLVKGTLHIKTVKDFYFLYKLLVVRLTLQLFKCKWCSLNHFITVCWKSWIEDCISLSIFLSYLQKY